MGKMVFHRTVEKSDFFEKKPKKVQKTLAFARGICYN